MNTELHIYSTEPCEEYELLDSGDGEKLERFGGVVLRRPDPQILWKKSLSGDKWQEAHAYFDKQWIGRKKVADSWNISIDGKTFKLKLSAFKHVGIFPEQRENWKWLESCIVDAKKPVSVLNLFGYTGGMTLAALKVGAAVTHVDGSKTALTWAKENSILSGLTDKSVRWILDDVLTFVKREIKRGNTYDVVVMDPPAFGHGPNKEVWKIENQLPELIALLPELLSKKPLCVLANGYASGYSSIAYENLLQPLTKTFGGSIEKGELVIAESGGRLLPAGISARWEARSQ